MRLDEWARSVADIMLRRAASADYDTWLRIGQKISRETRRKLKDAAAGPIFNRLREEQVALIRSLPMEAAKKAQEWAASGLSDGQRYADIAQRIKNELGGVTESRAICIARTETARARSNFTQARAQAVGSTHYVWHTVGDNAVRPRHRELDKTVHAWSDPPICDVGAGGTPIRSHPGCVFNCFPGDTLVRLDSDIIRVIRSPFNGCVVDIGCADSVITATPNHPMLTQRGWVPAGEINEGDYLLQAFGDTVDMVESDKQRDHVRIADLFDAFSGEAVRTAGTHFNFYGDVPDGDVDSAIVQGRLCPDIVAKLTERGGYFKLSGAAAVMSGVGHDVSHVRVPRALGEGPAIIERHSGEADDVCLGAIADRNVCLFEASSDSGPVDAKALSKSQDRFPGKVTSDDFGAVQFLPIEGMEAAATSIPRCIDTKGAEFQRQDVGAAVNLLGGIRDGRARLYKGFRVLNTFRRDFSGHVYTLETSKGWYRTTMNNYIVKNCRCWPEPLFYEKDK